MFICLFVNNNSHFQQRKKGFDHKATYDDILYIYIQYRSVCIYRPILYILGVVVFTVIELRTSFKSMHHSRVLLDIVHV